MAQMKASLKRLATFPPETEVVAGHGMPTTIAREVETNPYMD
jgi:glyoxylase-like metal-dependent hydrolase (beta-lactamase superfamily II)